MTTLTTPTPFPDSPSTFYRRRRKSRFNDSYDESADPLPDYPYDKVLMAARLFQQEYPWVHVQEITIRGVRGVFLTSLLYYGSQDHPGFTEQEAIIEILDNNALFVITSKKTHIRQEYSRNYICVWSKEGLSLLWDRARQMFSFHCVLIREPDTIDAHSVADCELTDLLREANMSGKPALALRIGGIREFMSYHKEGIDPTRLDEKLFPPSPFPPGWEGVKPKTLARQFQEGIAAIIELEPSWLKNVKTAPASPPVKEEKQAAARQSESKPASEKVENKPEAEADAPVRLSVAAIAEALGAEKLMEEAAAKAAEIAERREKTAIKAEESAEIKEEVIVKAEEPAAPPPPALESFVLSDCVSTYSFSEGYGSLNFEPIFV